MDAMTMDRGNGAMMTSKAWWSPSSAPVTSSCWPAHNYDDNNDDKDDDIGVRSYERNYDRNDDSNDDDHDSDGNNDDDEPAPDLPSDNFNCLLFAIAKPLNLFQWQWFLCGTNL